MAIRSSTPSHIYPSITSDAEGNDSIQRRGDAASSCDAASDRHSNHPTATTLLISRSDRDFATQTRTDKVADLRWGQPETKEVHQFSYGSLAGHITA